jgi:cytidyltransferase-like protein
MVFHFVSLSHRQPSSVHRFAVGCRFHAGDIETLKRARALGHFLYVGIHDDQAVNRYSGVNYPIMNLHERVLSVLSSRYVDEVCSTLCIDVLLDTCATQYHLDCVLLDVSGCDWCPTEGH